MAITMKNATRAHKRIARIPTLLELELRKQVHAAAVEVKDKAVAEVSAPKSGKRYTRRRRNKQIITWTASAPGQAPARKTGERIARVKVRKWNRANKPGAKIIAPGIYRLLERGMKNIKPRPLFGPLMAAFRAEYKRRMSATVGRAVGVAVKS